MKRIFEFIPNDHDIIISRTLVLIHQAIDSEFPEAKPASQRFAKTAFGDEPTLTKSLPGERAKGILSEENSTTKRSIADHPTSEEKTISEQVGTERLWKQSLIAILFLILCVILIYLIVI